MMSSWNSSQIINITVIPFLFNPVIMIKKKYYLNNNNNKVYAGFESASVSCCRNGPFSGIVPCGPTSSMCADRSKYLFWDPYHPSEAANLIVAKFLVDGDTKYISPINIRQLVHL